jgi:hypothetical protein
MKAFLVTSSATFAAIISADRASRGFETARDPSRRYRDRATAELEQLRQSEGTLQRLKDWARDNRYPIVTASWVASLGVALGMVSRDKYLTGAQKLVQARVYAQGLTIAILLATALLEVGDASKGKGRWETVKIIDPNDPEHKHLIEKRIHREAYEGEDLWRGMLPLLLYIFPVPYPYSWRHTNTSQIWLQRKSARSRSARTAPKAEEQRRARTRAAAKTRRSRLQMLRRSKESRQRATTVTELYETRLLRAKELFPFM